MKKFVIYILLLSFIKINAQNIKVTYEKKINIENQLKKIKNPFLRKLVKKKLSQPIFYELLYSDGISIYNLAKNTNNQNDESVSLEVDDNNVFYKDFKSKNLIKQAEFLSRTFLITNSLPKLQWKITNETKEIGKYKVTKAILKRNNEIIEAWFTNKIAVGDGPESFYGLPGLILELKTKNYVLKVKDIIFLKDAPKITKPEKGKKVSQSQFDKIVQKKNKNKSNEKKDIEVEIIRQ